MKYLGFTTESMLRYLNEHSKKVRLEKLNNEWRLYVLSDVHGEFEMTGCLTSIVVNAFKPIAAMAKAQREDAEQSLIDALNSEI